MPADSRHAGASEEEANVRTQPANVIVPACLLVLCAPAPTRAQVADKANEEKAIKALVEESVGWYQLYSDARVREAMTPHPVLRWRNLTRGTQESEGVLVLWVNQGWPDALASVYPWEGNLVHEFVSLSRRRSMVAREAGSVVWSPATAGVQYKELAGAPAPAATPAGRLRQMKQLADQFKVTLTGWRADRSDREELRLLPKPLYRYEQSEAPGPDPARIDGEVFAFVQGTDPEAILLLELVRENGRLRWQYAFARATSGGLEARLDKTIVWAADFRQGGEISQKPQITFRHPLGAAVSGR
jgi:hypothetical protein